MGMMNSAMILSIVDSLTFHYTHDPFFDHFISFHHSYHCFEEHIRGGLKVHRQVIEDNKYSEEEANTG